MYSHDFIASFDYPVYRESLSVKSKLIWFVCAFPCVDCWTM